MLFCQHKFSTWRTLGADWLNIRYTPHMDHLRGGKMYEDYLNASWREYPERIEKQLRHFENLALNIKEMGIKNPVSVIKRFNGDKMVFDGNHRYAIGKHFGLDIPENEISVDDYLKRNIHNTHDRFGTFRYGKPYQSLYYQGKKLVEGRRDDILQRHSLIDASDLRGKRVYDFGCNIGASSILAHESGAMVEAWDLPRLRTAAIRIFVLMNYDIRMKWPKGEYDTVFIFSVHEHANIPDIDARVFYIETHEDGGLPKRFSGAEKIGHLGKRGLYRYAHN